MLICIFIKSFFQPSWDQFQTSGWSFKVFEHSALFGLFHLAWVGASKPQTKYFYMPKSFNVTQKNKNNKYKQEHSMSPQACKKSLSAIIVSHNVWKVLIKIKGALLPYAEMNDERLGWRRDPTADDYLPNVPWMDDGWIILPLL